MKRLVLVAVYLLLSTHLLSEPAADGPGSARAREVRPARGTPVASPANPTLASAPRVCSAADPEALGLGAAGSAAATPAELSDVASRLHAARAELTPAGRVAAAPSPAAVDAPALSDRIGRDVTVRLRPGVGTPMQIRGARLQLRRQAAETRGDDDLATAREFLRANRALLRLADPDTELAEKQRSRDDLGNRHVKFTQRYRGLAVWPNELVVHLDADSAVYLMDGSFVPTPRLSSLAPIVDARFALRLARKAVDGGAAARASDPELFVYAPGTRPARLAWRVVVTPSRVDSWLVVIDAINGARLAKISQVMTQDVSGSGVDTNGLTRDLHVFRANGQYYLIDTSKPMYDPTSQPPDYKNTRGAIFVYDAAHTPDSTDPSLSDATWYFETSNDPNSWSPADTVGAAFGLSWTFDYYQTEHGRNSLDGKGGTIYSLVRIGSNFDNAFWSSSENAMCFGDGDNYSGSLDVVAHELTHGVTSNSADLIYQDQSGALNEAISDIFGEMVELYTYGSTDWLDGSELSTPSRSLADPASKGDPGTMSDYLNTDSDHGGVHHNSGIINHAFYYLAEGLNGAIGTHDAERIFYRALTVHLTQNSQFLDARLACIQSADELFGAGSVQSQRTADAFDNVEVFDAAPAPPPDDHPVNAADSTFFVARDANLRLARQENALGDPAQGTFVSSASVSEERPSVSGDGTLAFFVNSANDGCFVATNGSAEPSCLGLAGQIASVAMSRDADRYGFVLLDAAGNRDNRITVVDLSTSRAVTYELASAPTDGGEPAAALYADAMDFTANKRFLLYDALHEVHFADGSQAGLWSVSALDFSSSLTYAIVPPLLGFDIGFPAVAHTTDDLYTFEVANQTTGAVDVYTANLSTGAQQAVITGVSAGPTVPAYTGDDGAIVYTYPDASANTGRSLAAESLASDHMTAAGDPFQWIFDGEYGTIYRRGAYSGPTPGCAPGATTLCLSNGRFQVSATFTANSGQQGTALAVPLTGDTGYFTFFNPNNVEVVVKVLDACSIGQRLWVFAGGLTNVATILSVTDTLTGVTQTYTNPQSTPFQPVQDTSAFATCFAPSFSDASREEIEAIAAAAAYEVARLASTGSGAGTSPVVVAESTEAGAAACSANAQTLCLSNGRYRVQTSWRTADGRTGTGNAVGLTPDTGYFWFFNGNNVEMVVKVLNACAANGRYWTFAGGLTNVQVTMTVTDTQTGAAKTYTNPLGTKFRPIQDTSAFATCP